MKAQGRVAMESTIEAVVAAFCDDTLTQIRDASPGSFYMSSSMVHEKLKNMIGEASNLFGADQEHAVESNDLLLQEVLVRIKQQYPQILDSGDAIYTGLAGEHEADGETAAQRADVPDLTDTMQANESTVNAFCADIRRQLRHPKCLTFFMPTDKVYEKLEETFMETRHMAGQEDLEFTESRLWEMIDMIKRKYPGMLQQDNSIIKSATNCCFCNRESTHHYQQQPFCRQCYLLIQNPEGEEPMPREPRIECRYCQTTQKPFIAHLGILHCLSCRDLIKDITGE